MSVKVGDIVRTRNKEGKAVLPAVVTRVDERWGDIQVMFADGTHGCRSEGKYKLTMKHVDIQGVLDSIG